MPTATLLPGSLNASGGVAQGNYTVVSADGTTGFLANGIGTGVLNNNPYDPTNYGFLELNNQTNTTYASSNNGINFYGYPADWGVSATTGITLELDYGVTNLTDDSMSFVAELWANDVLETSSNTLVMTTSTSGVVSTTLTFGTISQSVADDWVAANVYMRFIHTHTRNMGADGQQFRIYGARVRPTYTPSGPPPATTVTPVGSTSASSTDTANVIPIHQPTTVTPVGSTSASSTDTAQVTVTYLPTTVTPVGSTSVTTADTAQITTTYLPTTVTPVGSTSVTTAYTANVIPSYLPTTVTPVGTTSASSTDTAQISAHAAPTTVKNLFLGDNRLLLIKRGDLDVPKAYLGDVLVFEGDIPPFAPTDLGTIVGWWDASDASTISESGGVVSAWGDKSGNGYDLTSLASNEPTTGTFTQNGLSVLGFGVNARMDAATAADWTFMHNGVASWVWGALVYFDSDASITQVFNTTSHVNVGPGVGVQWRGDFGINSLELRSRIPFVGGYARRTTSDASWKSNYSVASVIVDATDAADVLAAGARNNAAVAPASASSSVTTNTAEFALRLGVSGNDFRLGELVVALGGDTERIAIRDYLTTKWGTP